MGPSKAAHRGAAAHAGAGAAQRTLIGHGGGFAEAGDPLDRYLKSLADWVKQAGYTVDGKRKRCIWCTRETGLHTGSLPYVGAILFCASCEPLYRTCKERQVWIETEESEPDTKVHMRDAWDASACGVGRRTSLLMRDVTCRRCRAWYGTNSLPRSVFDFLLGKGR